jgi:hypothetical protein
MVACGDAAELDDVRGVDRPGSRRVVQLAEGDALFTFDGASGDHGL